MELNLACKEIRQRLNISQRQLASMIGTNQTDVSFIERGFIPNDIGKIKAIYKIYDNCKGVK